MLCFTEFAFINSVFAKVETSLGAFYSDKRVYRGALIWEAPVAIVAPSFIINDFLSIGQGGGISVFKSFGESQKVTLGYSYFDDNEPNGPVIELGEAEEDFKNKRKPTQGAFLRYDYKRRGVFSLGLEYHKDWMRHSGNYVYIRLGSTITPFFRYGIGAGIGDARHNRYVYGESGEGGVAHQDIHLGLFLPFLPWRGVLMMNWTRTQISQRENINAEFIRGKEINRAFSVIAVWRF